MIARPIDRATELRIERDAALIEVDLIRKRMEKDLAHMGELIDKAERLIAELERMRNHAPNVVALQPHRKAL